MKTCMQCFPKMVSQDSGPFQCSYFFPLTYIFIQNKNPSANIGKSVLSINSLNSTNTSLVHLNLGVEEPWLVWVF